jgi:hypothetical protein
MGIEDTTGTNAVAHYGPRDVEKKYGGIVSNGAGTNTIVITFDYDDLPAATYPGIQAQIPAGAVVTAARFDVLTAFTSTSTTTDLQVGIADADGGSNITDVDAIFTAGELTQTVIAEATNITAAAAGASLGTSYAEAAVITVTPNVADLTAGKARLEVDYKVYADTYTAPTGT